MAAFDLKPDHQPTSNFTNYSKGVRANRNTALGALFQGVAKAADAGIREADRHTKETIRNDIFDEVDRIQEGFGVGDATNLRGGGSSQANTNEDGTVLSDLSVGTPDALQQSMSSLATLQDAYGRGAFRESHYWAQMNSVVRRMRTQYPGYRAEIDQMISSITGAKPANALRSALFSEWAANSEVSDDSPSALDRLVERASFAGVLPADYEERLSTQPYTFTELNLSVAAQQRAKAEVDAERARLSSASTEGRLTEEMAEDSMTAGFASIVNDSISQTVEQSGGFQTIKAAIDSARVAVGQGREVDQQRLIQAQQGMETLIQNMTLKLYQAASTPFSEAGEDSYLSTTSPAAVDAAIETALAPYAVLQQALSSGNPNSLFAASAAVQEASKDKRVARVLEENPLLEGVRILNNTVGPAAAGKILDMQEGSDATQLALNSIDLASLGDPSTSRTVGDSLNSAARIGPNQTGPAVTNAQQSFLNFIDNFDEIPDKIMRNMVHRMFSDPTVEILERLDRDSGINYFSKITSPAVTQRMLSLKQRYPDSWNTYQTWVAEGFTKIFKAQVQELTGLGEDPGSTMRYDPATTSFIWNSSDDHGLAGHITRTFRGDPTAGINLALRNIAPIVENNGGSMETEILILLQAMGYEQGRVGYTPGQQEGFLYKMGEALNLNNPAYPRLRQNPVTEMEEILGTARPVRTDLVSF